MGNALLASAGIGVLSINGQDCGYLKGSVEAGVDRELLDLRVLVPQQLVSRITIQYGAHIKGSLIEIFNPNALSAVLGGQTNAPNAGSELHVTTGTAYTFAADPLIPGFQSIQLFDPTASVNAYNISTGGHAAVVKDSTEATTYSGSTDYLVDTATGKIIRYAAAAGGTITSGEVVHVTSYYYTPYASNQFNLGATFAVAQVPVTFTHTNPETGKLWTTAFWLASGVTKPVKFEERNWNMMEIEYESLQDSVAHPTNPFGYILMQV